MSDGYLGNGKTVLCRAEDAEKYTSIDAINRSEDLLDYVNEFLAKEKGSGRIDELAEEYFYKYVEDEALEPAA